MPLGVEPEEDQLLIELVRGKDPIANRELRQHGVLFGQLRAGIIGPLDIRAEVAGKFDRLAVRGERGGTVVRNIFASAICDATARFQINS